MIENGIDDTAATGSAKRLLRHLCLAFVVTVTVIDAPSVKPLPKVWRGLIALAAWCLTLALYEDK